MEEKFIFCILSNACQSFLQNLTIRKTFLRSIVPSLSEIIPVQSVKFFQRRNPIQAGARARTRVLGT